ncbi:MULTISPECIES: sulfate adenylyltransferase subunit CysN [unclassified Shinella]|uniref:sulfate adenylyltransferase subunit CysN n=1 Tax=unclassified Shinella TaxID=2643062 RepID=UPI00225D1B3D|nr:MULTISPECIES: sulfate adenylyltransferase subunit CysN [unclassified Shinella]MCO5153719.1 sulfate adenylyltransferase subunit CysN [Shinella sp.]MDC7259973.1 sulfate adenylyltransferase subunit CysN [Shinella sp. YE25]CAI0341651.1 Sulfate adenylyltransferase subunit 1 / Adenylyl-sulfate kinase [Rhizobiaceae bacterium]CAK7261964.1 Sulfate adenylyltransferase subunit 1 / Adenylyl-sulfate kinase [Shinella sp. WSC3-e]
MAAAAPDLSARGIADYLREQENKSLLRFLTCGSVDDGKSTLIGRLLYDTKLIFEDQLAALERDSRRHGTAGDEIDFALLVDGLEAEREQGITIDVAYRFFATDRRKFIVADTPGHEEYTRNMATGASTADLAVVLVDARQGILRQTCRHAYIASLLGIRHIVLAVNKIDLVGYDRAVFDGIVADFRAFAGDLGFTTIQPIPLSARHGDNVTRPSENTPWYQGPHLLDHLETVPVEQDGREKPFRFPVQYVSRPDLDFRGFAGQVASGSVAVGDPVTVAKSGQSTRIRQIVTRDGSLDRAVEGQAVTLVLADELDVSRGNMLVAPGDRPVVADQFQAHVIWFDATPLIPGRNYILRTETDSVETTVTALKYEVDVNTFAHLAAKALHMNGVAVCNFSTRAPIAFDSYAANRATGNFVLIDRMSNRTVGAGMIDFGLRRAENVHWQAMEVDRRARAALKHQKAAVVWFTGLSGSGKSTVANRLERLLHAEGRHTYMLDGDNVRHGLNKDLGFTAEDRVENIRRVAEVAKLMSDAGLIVLVSFISPFRSERQLARDLMVEGEFIEVFVDTPIEECARRDPKGLYKKAMRGELANFTGISSPYEAPENPEVHLQTVGADPDALAMRIHAVLERRMEG